MTAEDTRDGTRERPRDGGAAPLQALQGTVEVVTFHSEESLYTVLRIDPERGYDDPESTQLFRSHRVTAVGPMDRPHAGQRLRLAGKWTDHRSHGRQFVFESVEPLSPTDPDGLVKYLASPAFPGVGEKLARRIVATLGTGALEIVRAEPERLAEVTGLRRSVREAIVESVQADYKSHRLQAFLRSVGLGPRQAAAVLRKLGADAEELLRADPYRIAAAVPRLGFRAADRIARSLGFAEDAPERCRAIVLHRLREASSEGHSLLYEERLVAEAAERIDVAADRIRAGLEELARAGELTLEDAPPGARVADRRVYLPWLATSECGLARNVLHLLEPGSARPLAGPAELARAERESSLTLDDGQRAAVLGLLREPVALLTGGPGVGKTTIVRLVVALAEKAGAVVRLASPTGRAAKRLAEATGRPAATVHRLLGFEPGGGFAHDDGKPLEADLIVVDEISMLDVVLAHHLLKAVQPPTRLVLVGDPDQLPSVAPGNVLHDLIASERVPLFRLTNIHRQGAGSLITRNAHRILRGEEPERAAKDDAGADFFVFPAEEPEHIARRTVEVVTERIPSRFGLDWVRDVQVLAPMYRGECGVDSLNERLRAALGAAGDHFQIGDRRLGLGDRVIHTRNDYEKEVFNGDMGRIVRVSEDGLTVAFPEQSVFYASDELADLQPAFAITVHRSQGSEYPAVVIPLSTHHHVMLQRNLLYTAVTRARSLCVLVGSRRALRRALENDEQALRLSGLADRLRAQADSAQ